MRPQASGHLSRSRDRDKRRPQSLRIEPALYSLSASRSICVPATTGIFLDNACLVELEVDGGVLVRYKRGSCSSRVVTVTVVTVLKGNCGVSRKE